MTEDLRQRLPRVENPAYLVFVRAQPCAICAAINTEAAHIRSTLDRVEGKRSIGGAEKPDDKWAVPLCNAHHREQHSMNELAFWKKYGIDPFKLALRLWAAFLAAGGKAVKSYIRKPRLVAKSDTPREDRDRPKQTIPSRPFQNRAAPWGRKPKP